MRILFIPLLCIVLSACTNTLYAFKSPTIAPDVKSDDELRVLEQKLNNEPKNLVLRTHIARQKELLSRRLLDEAAMAISKEDFETANQLLDKVFNINPSSSGAKEGKRELEAAKRHAIWLTEAQSLLKTGRVDQAELKLKSILLESPQHAKAKTLMRQLTRNKNAQLIPASLKANISKPITLEFKETTIKTIFEMIARSSNINFIFDKEVKGDTKATIFVRNTKIEEAIKVILVTNQLSQKVLSDNTILIYPNNTQKHKEYQELVVRNFYLANTDIKQMVNVIKTIVKTNDIVYDEKLNMLTMRDTPEAIQLAEKLIAAQDMAEPEVMLELEVLEVSRTRLQELGVRLPERASFSALNAAGVSPGSLTLDEWRGINSSRIRASITDPSLILNLRRLDTDTNLLANPRIRVKNREKAKVHIGEKVPVITTTSTANVGVSENVTYLDVGLKLDIEPNVYLEDEVSMKVGLEVSNIIETIVRASGVQTYRLGTRNTSTTLRLNDGETQILAGLIQDDERKAVNKLPGIGDLPLLGRLFSNADTTNTKTEIVLLITPRVIRNIQQPDSDIAEFASGTADAIGATPLHVHSQEKGANTPVISGAGTPISVPTPPSVQLPSEGAKVPPINPQPIAAPGVNGSPVPLPPPPMNIAPDASVLPSNAIAETEGEAETNQPEPVTNAE